MPENCSLRILGSKRNRHQNCNSHRKAQEERKDRTKGSNRNSRIHLVISSSTCLRRTGGRQYQTRSSFSAQRSNVRGLAFVKQKVIDIGIKRSLLLIFW